MSRVSMNSKAGQFFMQKILMAFATLVVLMALFPTIQTFISTGSGNFTALGGDSGTVILINLIPLFFILGFLVYLFAFDRV